MQLVTTDRILIAVLVGLGASFYLNSQIFTRQSLLVATLVACCWLVAAIVRRSRHQFEGDRQALASMLHPAYLAAVLCGILWGGGNAFVHQQQSLSPEFWQQKLTVRLRIDDIPVFRADATAAHSLSRWQLRGTVLAAATIEGAPVELAVQQVALQWYQPSPRQHPKLGEVWRFNVRLKPPQSTRNEGSPSWHRLWVRDGIDALGTIAVGRRLVAATGPAKWRQVWWQRLQALQASPAAGVLLALSFGERQWLAPEDYELFKQAGVAHLIAISGLHLSLVAVTVAWLFWWLYKRLYGSSIMLRHGRQRECGQGYFCCAWLGWCIAFSYAWVTGFAVATERALLMLAVALILKQFAAATPAFSILLRAAAVVVIFDPLALLAAGFWLSVLAVAVLITLQPAAANINEEERYWQRWWRQLVMLWRLEWLLTLALIPLMLLVFGGVSWVAPFTNLVLVPVITLWVLPLALVGMLALWLPWPALSQVSWSLAGYPVAWLLPKLEALLAQVQPWLDAGFLGLIWVAFGVWVIARLPLVRRTKLILSLLLGLGMTFHEQREATRADALTVYVLDVGHGNATVVARGRHAMLIDTGPGYGRDTAYQRIVRPFLRTHQLQLEQLFISHADADHASGAAAALRDFPSLLWRGAGGWPCVSGQRGEWRDVRWQVLHPQRSSSHQHNNDSCVVRLQYGDFSLLLPGDIEGLGEATVLGRQQAQLRADILLVPHHGSLSSSSAVLLRHVQPAVAIFSRARLGRWELPATEVLARYFALGIVTRDTAQGGQITIRTDGRQWQLVQPLAEELHGWIDTDPFMGDD